MKKYYFKDKSHRKAISCCSKPLEYLGSEIGQEPPEKTFTVYRDKAEVIALVDKMLHLPITKNHIPITDTIINQIGHIKTTELHYEDDEVCLTHAVEIEGASVGMEFSLGYLGELKPYKDGFMQYNLEPHHMALLDGNGRCGSTCKLYDGKTHKFKDDTIHNTNQIKGSSMTIAELLAGYAGLADKDQKSFVDGLKITPKIEYKDKIKEVPAKVTAKMKQEIATQAVETFIDSQAFTDTMKKENEAYAIVRSDIIEKAKHFLDTGYDFKSKSNEAIMSDAVVAEYTDTKYEDHEVATAFKTLDIGAKVEAKVELKDSADKKELEELADKEY